MAEPVVVTGAAGKTGRAVCRELAAAGVAVRALVRRPDQEPPGAAEVRVVELRDRAAFGDALAGAGAVYFIWPNLSSDEAEMGRRAVAAAVAAGASRFVYHSVLHPLTEKMPHHWQKLRVEEALLEADLDWTVLQPAPYMQNLLAGWFSIVERGEHRVPYARSSRISLVDLDDVAAVAARVLTEEGHRAATYPLVGTPPLSQDEVAEVLAQGVGRDVRVVERQAAEVRTELEERGLDAYAVDGLMRMFDYYQRFGLEGSTGVLGWLLGRSPTDLAAFVQRTEAARTTDEVD